jgi:hypothetical protein
MCTFPLAFTLTLAASQKGSYCEPFEIGGLRGHCVSRSGELRVRITPFMLPK